MSYTSNLIQTNMSSKLQEHLAQEHKLSPQAQYISEIVYGGVDGIVTTFAVIAGFAGAGSESHIAQLGSLSVVLFGLANLMGDYVSMALGKYLSTRSEQDLYQTARDKESYEIILNHGDTVLMIEHDPNVLQFADDVITLHNGTLHKK